MITYGSADCGYFICFFDKRRVRSPYCRGFGREAAVDYSPYLVIFNLIITCSSVDDGYFICKGLYVVLDFTRHCDSNSVDTAKKIYSPVAADSLYVIIPAVL